MPWKIGEKAWRFLLPSCSRTQIEPRNFPSPCWKIGSAMLSAPHRRLLLPVGGELLGFWILVVLECDMISSEPCALVGPVSRVYGVCRVSKSDFGA
ncbi:hypothetical protein SLEP1_g56778 [Rubroshorea leprosula]|uniref:Uncharacterized protein n=1 Tax=Rubroshorea leprosula TaxID=152421 RepID=A0AAV5MN86_9ROSI|nr:hypothetical protein SLEP1_g56778 [Rubroshorea leprosula]